MTLSRRGWLVSGAGLLFGLGAEWVEFGWGDPVHWVPDLLVGWMFIGGGVVASARRPDSAIGGLLAATGFAWFVGNYSALGWAPAAWIAAQATYLHRSVLIHTVLAYPSGRVSTRLVGAVVALGYAVALMPSVARSGVATAALGVALGVTAGREYLEARGPERRARVPAVRAAALLGGVLVAVAVAHLAFPAGELNELVLLAYQAALCATAVMLTGGLRPRAASDAAVADLVVELGAERTASLRDGLARALGEPALEVGYWSPRIGGYVDASGAPLDLPGPGAPRSVTVIRRGAEPVAALVHDPAVLADSALVDGIAAAARVAAVNSRLQAEVRAQLAELQESRRRLLDAGDEERRRLELRLREGAERRLLELSGTLARVHERSVGSSTALRLARAERQLALTLDELHELARGLHPGVLSEEGLAGAVGELAARSAIPVKLSVSAEGLPGELEAALYFVCAEALANVAKHASASAVAIVIERAAGCLTARISDDGIGGADLACGSGLRGLADRVEALGGTFELDSPVAGGTRLTVELRLGR
jgi:signal transduction histidine kinase